MAGKRVLVTGGGGFIGRNMVPLLVDAGYDIMALSLGAPPGELRESCQWLDRNLLQQGVSKAVIEETRPDLLLHLAWEARPGIYWTAESNMDWVAASLELFRAFYALGGKRGVAAGTCAEYEWGGGAPFVENVSATRPATLYGAAKLAFATLTHQWAIQSNAEFAWGRIFYTFGKFESTRRVIPYVINSLLNGKPAETSSGTKVRDYIYVWEVARAFLAILESSITGPVNIGSGEGIPTAVLLERVSLETGNPGLWKKGARPDAQGEPDAVVADISRLLNATGYQPATTLKEAIVQTVAWWRSTPAQS